MKKLNLSAPWTIFFNEVASLFGGDPEIVIKYDEENYEIELYVDNPVKADALSKILPAERTFGNVTVTLTVTPSNEPESDISIYQKAFAGNPAFSYATTTDEEAGFNGTYVVFANKVVQYFADNLGDVNRNRSTLYQDIADRIIEEHPGVFFCTDIEEDIDDVDDPIVIL